MTVALVIGAESVARATDSAMLQFTVPAPDPVTAGETLALQALAINTGATKWTAGSYYWVGEVYDLDQKLLARTDEVSPREDVAPGAVAAISLSFHVPDTMEGRKLYRVFLIKDAQTLLQSDFKPFQVTEKPIAPPPEVVDYHLEGNITTTYKNSSSNHWGQSNGATSINSVGKIRDSSYLFNSYFLHTPGNVVDPFIIVGNLYAPWGTIYAGDINPTLSPLSVSGQGMRGGMLEQHSGSFDWDVLGGETITSQPGTSTTNGRYARTLYAAKGGVDLGYGLKGLADYFLSADETGSLSTDPTSPKFRGPTLVPQKNSGLGASLTWEPKPRTTFAGHLQRNQFYADVSGPAVSDTAWRGDFQMDRKLFKLKTYVQRAGPNFHALGAPTVVGDRLTMDGNLGVFPVRWYNLALSADQYHDNLANDPSRVRTTQRVVTLGNNFVLPTATNLGLTVSQNSAKGNPSSALDNQTNTAGLAVGQPLGKHNVSLNAQVSQFRDNTGLAHNLDTQTTGLSSTWRLPRNWTAAFGVTLTDAKDKVDGSARISQSVSPSVSFPIVTAWTGQVYGTWTKTKNTSTSFPSDQTVTNVNSEFTWTQKQTTLTLGVGGNEIKDTVNPGADLKELTVLFRYSYSF